MAENGTVAVLLPGAFYFLREKQLPPIDALRKAGVHMAVASDCNPGTSPMTSPLAALNMACTLFRLTPGGGARRHHARRRARAGILDDVGTLEVGKAADLAVWDVKSPAELSYWLGAPLLRERVFAGRVVCERRSARSRRASTARLKQAMQTAPTSPSPGKRAETWIPVAITSRVIRAPRGMERTCKSWLTEAALRMLMNNLDPDVAEHPEELVVYGGIGRAARDWKSYDKIVETLRRLEEDETLLIQSGKPVGVFKTHADAPRVLLANSNLVPRWATWEHFDELDRKGLMMYGQMTAGSWIYIGTQGIVQGTYETFAEMGRKHFGGDWTGKWILTAGLGGMGGAQPLAAVMAGACCLAIECQSDRIDKRLQTRYLDKRAETLDEAMKLINEACAKGEAISVGLLGNAAEILPEMVEARHSSGRGDGSNFRA